MRILFSMRHPGALRNFASTLRELERRGHTIHLAFQMQDKLGDGRLLWELTQEHPGITYAEFSKKTPWRFWLGLARGVRFCADYVRYETPEYRQATALRERAASRVPGFFRFLCRLPLVRTRAGLRAVSRMVQWCEQAIPIDRWVADQVAAQKPDVVLVTPLVDLGSDQVEYIKAAKALGVRSGLLVHSWDNLTNKGLIRVSPDRVFVWNEAQKVEAVTMHGSKPENVVVTGATVYDQWFARTPSTTRSEFCRKAGLDPDTPFFLYLGSSQFIAPDEGEFVAEWVRALRSAPDPRVREAGILVRPHPENQQPWDRFDFLSLPNVAVWPRGGANPVDAPSKNDFYDSMFHSSAAVGINTSAQIESGITGKPVYSISVARYEGTQEGTLHFHYLLNQGNGGLLHLAPSLDEHVKQIAGALDRTEADAQKLRAFIQAFVRPNGLDVPATPLMADGIEALARLPKPAPERPAAWLYLVRALLYPVAIALKVARQFKRLSRKRERQLRPLSLGGSLMKVVFRGLDYILRWGPMKRFARRYVVPRVVPQMMSGDHQSEEMVAIPRVLQKLARSERPLIVGPWLSEVGFELLYWIPFLNWARTYRHFDPDRVVVISRGGVAPWYASIGNRYMDLFDFFTPEQFRAKNERRQEEGKQKQQTLGEFDRDILKLAHQHLGTRDVDVLHPMYMYRLFYAYWKGQMSLKVVDSFASFQRLPAIDASDIQPHLPADYVAMRFYFNESFPDTEANRVFVRRLLASLTETTDVVLLNPGLSLDDHSDLMPEKSARVHTVGHLMTPRNNLEIQSKVISRARAFVGTYGGLSYLPPMYGVNSLAFYSRGEAFSVQHLELARRVFSRTKRGSFVVLDTNDLDVLGLAFGERLVASS